MSGSRPHVPALLRPWAERLVADVLEPRPGATCLDMPCGEGVLSAVLARAVGPGGAVTAVDTDPRMIAACAAEVDVLSLATVTVILSSGVDPCLPAAGHDVAGSLFTLAHRPDPAALLAASARALRPGGRLAAAVWSAPGAVPPIDHLAAAWTAVTGTHPAALDAALSLGAPGSLEAVVAAAGLGGARVDGLRDVVRFHGPDHLVATLCAAHGLEAELEELDDAALASLLELVSIRLLPHTLHDGTLVVPVEAAVLVLDL